MHLQQLSFNQLFGALFITSMFEFIDCFDIVSFIRLFYFF